MKRFPRRLIPVLGMIAVLTSAQLLLAHPIHAEETPAEKLRAYLEEAESLGFSGCVLAIRKGETILHKGYGLAQRDPDVPVTPETAFVIGSITKMFTKAAVLKLEEEGKLTLEDPITQHLPAVPEDKKGVTVRHLVEHTAGLHEYHTREDHARMTRDEALEVILEQELLFTPGEREAYSNPGYTLLAAVIEYASGTSYQEYLREHLLKPAGLKRTGFFRERLWDQQDVAHGYDARKAADPNSPLYWPEIQWALMGNGGLVSSPAELHTWIRALNEGKVLSEAGFKKYYGLDMPSDDSGPRTYAYAGGNDFGFVTVVVELPDEEMLLIGSSNSGTHRIENQVHALIDILRGREVRSPKETNAASAEREPQDWGLPESPTGHALRAFLNAVYVGTEKAMREFVESWLAPEFRDQFGVEGHLGFLRQLHEELPNPEILDLKEETPHVVRATIGSGGPGPGMPVAIQLEETEPHRIAVMQIGG